jgi:integrase
MATIWKRAPYQFCARIRRNGVSETKTFETKSEAQEWARVTEGKVTGNEILDQSKVRGTNLAEAFDWYEQVIVPETPRSAAGKLTQVNYWRASRFASWALISLHPWDLIDWRREVLDEDDADDGEQVGPHALFGPQTCVHRLNAISHLFGRWSLVHRIPLPNPVVRGVRPALNNSRDRRLEFYPDVNGETEEVRLYRACDASNSKWLGAAARIAIETCMRQAELAGLIWSRVHLSGQYPFADLPQTKNDRPRRVPLSSRAVRAFRSLIPEGSTPIGNKKVFSIETPRAVGHAFRGVAKDAEFPDLRWHDLRHEAISRLFENTDLRDHEIMAITGHLSPEMLKRYSHLRSHKLAIRLG